MHQTKKKKKYLRNVAEALEMFNFRFWAWRVRTVLAQFTMYSNKIPLVQEIKKYNQPIVFKLKVHFKFRTALTAPNTNAACCICCIATYF